MGLCTVRGNDEDGEPAEGSNIFWYWFVHMGLNMHVQVSMTQGDWRRDKFLQLVSRRERFCWEDWKSQKAEMEEGGSDW